MRSIESEIWVLPKSRYRSDYILRIGDLTERQRLVLLSIDAHDGPKGCTASNARLGDIVGLAESVVKKDITVLRAKGFIVDLGSALNRRVDLSGLGVPKRIWSELKRSHAKKVAEVCAHDCMNARMKLLLFVIHVTSHPHSRQKEKGLPGCSLSNQELADRMSAKKRSVEADIQRLSKKGWLESNGAKGRGRILWFFNSGMSLKGKRPLISPGSLNIAQSSKP